MSYIESVRYCFSIVRKNAKACPNLHGGRFIQKNRKDAYIEYLEYMLNETRKELENVRPKN